MLSPPAFLGKRRADFDEQTFSANELVSSFDQSFKKIRIRTLESPSHGGSFDPENCCPQAGLGRGPQSAHKLLRSDSQSGDGTKNMQSSHQYLEQQVKFLECQIASLRAEQQLLLTKKSAELTDVYASKLKLSAELQKTQREKEASLQEAKILKKAVAIQDQRQKEVAVQNQQLHDCLRLALSKLEAYEQANRSLQYELNLHRQGSSSSFDFFPPQPPPDVF